MIRILIADDHAVVRAGLRQIIAETTDMVVTAEASNGQEVLERLLRDDFDVVLLDIAMPGRDGVDTLKQIKNQKPELPVLILSMYPEEQYALRVLKAGASGYMTKESAPEELVEAVRKVSGGEKYVSPTLAERLVSALTLGDKPLHEKLSDREYQVMCMIAKGKSVTEIAGEMSLSVKTISTYRTRILEKMNIKTNAQLTLYAIENRLVD